MKTDTLYKWLLGLSFWVFFSTGCEKELPYPENTWVPRPVVHCIYSPGSNLKVFVSETQTPRDSVLFRPLKDAVVRLLDSSMQVVNTLYFRSSTGAYESGFKARPGTRYYLEVVHTQLGYTCIALDRTPNIKPSFTADTATVFLRGQEGFFQFSLLLSDDATDSNFYRIQASRLFRSYRFTEGRVDSVDLEELMQIQTSDFRFLESTNPQFSNTSLLLPDTDFKGRVAQINLGTFDLKNIPDNERNLGVKLTIRSLSPHLFQYSRSLFEHRFYQSDPFSRTIPVFSSFSCGVGVFGSFQSDSIVYLFE